VTDDEEQHADQEIWLNGGIQLTSLNGVYQTARTGASVWKIQTTLLNQRVQMHTPKKTGQAIQRADNLICF
jgi:hypothetical protein